MQDLLFLGSETLGKLFGHAICQFYHLQNEIKYT